MARSSHTNVHTKDVRQTVAKKLRFLLRTESITIDQMADRIGVTPEHLRYVVDGVSKPTRHLLEKLCAAFNVTESFFGKDVAQILEEPRDSQQNSGETNKKTAPLPFTPKSKKCQPVPIGIIPDTAQAAGANAPTRKKRKFDLAELAAHHQALLECLIEKKVVSQSAYQEKLGKVRRRAGLT